MLTENEFYIQSLRDHLYYLRAIRQFCITVELSFYKNNLSYIERAKTFAQNCEKLIEEAISYTNGIVSKSAIDNEIYVTKYTLACEELTRKLFGIEINTTLTNKELSFQEGLNSKIGDVIEKIETFNSQALSFAKEFSAFCTEIRDKQNSNNLFSFSYSDFFNYLFDEVDTYILDLERIIAKEGYSPIYAVGYEYKFSITLEKTAKFIRDWVDPGNSDIVNLATYYINSFDEIINLYLTASISPDVQEKLAIDTNNLLKDYQDFLKNILDRLIKGELYFITPAVSIDNVYTSVNFYKFILDIEEGDVK